MDALPAAAVENVDIIQVGARNMQNFNLLKVLGAQEKPVMIKRGLSSTYEEWLMSAEYVMASGNEQVILCERGIRTYETYTRNTLDISAIPVLRHLTHLPIIVDPSHAGGRSALVAPLSLSAVAAGCDGLLIEVHNDPAHAAERRAAVAQSGSVRPARPQADCAAPVHARTGGDKMNVRLVAFKQEKPGWVNSSLLQIQEAIL